MFTNSIFKAAVVERFNRTLKQKMYRIFTEQKNTKYIHILKELVESYNRSYHSSIKMAPINVNKKNEKIVFANLYGKDNDFIVFALKKGDYVRTKIDKKLFEKGYTPNWSTDIFIVSQLRPTNPPTYHIKSINNQPIKDYFNKQELQLVSLNEFPYDTFNIIDTNKKLLLVEQLNTNKIKNSQWVEKSFFTNEDKSIDTNNSNQLEISNKLKNKEIHPLRVTRSSKRLLK